MNNKFSLSFGISLVIVGILNIFFSTNNMILFGLSVSTIMFSLVNLIVPSFENQKLEMLYIVPFIILVSIFCYSNSLLNIETFSEIVNGKTKSVLTFISFGFLFISEFINYKREEYQEMCFEFTRVIGEYEYSTMILEQITNYLRNLNEKEIIIDSESEEFLYKIQELCSEKVKLAHINGDLLKLEKIQYTLEEINDIYKQVSDIDNYASDSEDCQKK